MAKAIDLEIAELNPEAPETTTVDLEIAELNQEAPMVDLEIAEAQETIVDIEALVMKITDDCIRKKMIWFNLEIAEQNRDLDCISAEMRADTEALGRKLIEDFMRVAQLERQMKIKGNYNRPVKKLRPMPMPMRWVLEKPFFAYYNFLEWMFEFKLDPFQEKPRRRKVWAALGVCSWFFTFVFGGKDPDDHTHKSSLMIGLRFLYDIWIMAGYPLLLFYLYNIRHPLHYVLRRSHKQLLESALVLLSSSWVYYTTDDNLQLSIAVPFLCLDVIPWLNLWWSFENFGFFDCCLFILIEAAMICCRHRGVVVLMAVTVVGLAMQFMKNAYRKYRSHKIKNQTLDHLI